MTCYLCNKEYSRLQRHLRMVHKLNDSSVEPSTLNQFIHLISLQPIILSNEEMKSVQSYMSDGVELSPHLYMKIKDSFMDYTKTNTKLVIKIARRVKKC